MAGQPARFRPRFEEAGEPAPAGMAGELLQIVAERTAEDDLTDPVADFGRRARRAGLRQGLI